MQNNREIYNNYVNEFNKDVQVLFVNYKRKTKTVERNNDPAGNIQQKR